MPAAAFVLVRRFRRDDSRLAAYSWLSGIGTAAFLVAAFALPDAAGTLQRVSVVVAYAWIARVMWHDAREAI